eukprot:g22047.t1
MRIESNRASIANLTRLTASNAGLSNYLQGAAQRQDVGRNNATSQPRDTLTLSSNSSSAITSVTSGGSAFRNSRDVLKQIRSQLTAVRTLATGDRNGQLSASKRAASQLQIDQLIGQVQQMAGTFGSGQSKKVNDPATTSTLVASSLATPSAANEVTINARSAALVYSGVSGGLVQDTATFKLTGNLGNAEITLTQGETLTDVAGRVNALSDSTGVKALVSGNKLLFESVDSGKDASVSIELLSLGSSSLTISELNESQLAAFNIDSIQQSADHTISGFVTSAAKAAELKYVGGSGGVVTDSSSFVLTGDLGQATISINRGESLSDAAARINAQAETTGVTASVDGNELVFNSAAVGSSANIEIEVTSIEKVTGVNATQLAGFVVDEFDPNSNESLTAEVTKSAQQAQLKYAGDNGSLVKDDGSFTLAGNSGSVTISVTEGESLADVAARINTQSNATGVTASVDGDDLFLNSVGYGTAAQVFVDVTAGSFGVSGGTGYNGGKIDYGTDVEATVNGTDFVGQGNTLSYSSAKGSYSFDFADGFEGQLDSISVISASTSDVVNVSPVNSGQIATFQVNSIPLDSSETISGQVDEVAERAQLKYRGDGGSVVKDDGTFTLTGSSGSVSFSVTEAESLSDVADRINAQSGATGVTASVDGNDLLLDSVDYGSNAQVFVEVTAGEFNVSGGSNFNGGKIDYGVDVEAKINGIDVVGSGNTLSYGEGPGSYTIEFADGFSGTFDSIDVTSTVGADDLTDGAHLAIAGVNSAQFAGFQVNSAVTNSTQTVTGEVLQVGERALLVYEGGNGGVVSSNATFTLTGNLGSASYSVTQGESLTDVADRINAESLQTGIVASVDGDNLQLNSTEYGSDAEATIEVTSGVLGLLGLTGPETDYGVHAEARFNGVTYTGDGNHFEFNDASGSFSVDLAPGFAGTFDPVTVRSIENAFTHSGGNGDATADGADAQATINGQSLTGTGNSFSFSDEIGSFSIEFAGGFTGQFDSVEISYTTGGVFSLSGGNGNGTAVGEDARTIINGPIAARPSSSVSKIRKVDLPEKYRKTKEKSYGNRMFFTKVVADRQGTIRIAIDYEVTRREVTPQTGEPVSDVDRKRYLRANRLVPLGGKPLELLPGKRLAGTSRADIRLLYDRVDAHVRYHKPAGGNWGRGDVLWVCDSRFGNCSDFHSLFIALCRSHGVPARFHIGFPISEKAKGSVGGYHCWAEFADGKRWFSVDISEADKNPARKDYYFGRLPADRVMFTTGRDLILAPKQKTGPLNFFVYPHVEHPGRKWTQRPLKSHSIDGRRDMGAWGTGLFSDDVTCDVRAQFRDLLDEHVSVAVATRRILADWQEALEDPDDGPQIWLALASLQWDRGALQTRVRSKALRVIDSGSDLERWLSAADGREVSQRRSMLKRLRKKLISTPPKPASPSSKRKSVSKRNKPVPRVEWKLGDVVAYRLKSKNWVLMHIVELNGHGKAEDVYPTFAVLDWSGPDLLSASEIEELPYRKPPETTLAWGDAAAEIGERRAYCLSVAHRKLTGIPLGRLKWTGLSKPLPFRKPKGWNPGVLWRLLDRQLELDLGLN